MKTGVVKEFRGEYAFLSNHYTAVFEWRDYKWFCGEQAFQWAKTLYPRSGEKERCRDLGKRLRDTGKGATAKRYGREIPLDVDAWDAAKVDIMAEIVHARFLSSQDLSDRLLATGAMLLVEGNTWGDVFWGRCNGKGLNTLGVLLMEERGYLKKDINENRTARYLVPPRSSLND